jgi:hypothetical protein
MPSKYTEPTFLTRTDFQVSGRYASQIEKMFATHGLTMNEPSLPNALPVTHCSANKGVGASQFAVPRDFYISRRNLNFYKNCGSNPYGILSDLYGLHMFDEELEGYDIHPSQRSNADLHMLGGLIRAKAISRGVSAIMYVTDMPSTMVPYLVMLTASGIPYTIRTRFNVDSPAKGRKSSFDMNDPNWERFSEM